MEKEYRPGYPLNKAAQPPTSPIPGESELESDFRREVSDAAELLAYAVSHGFKDATGRRPDDRIIEQIKKGQDLVDKGEKVPAAERAAFEKAYFELTLLVAPVTIETLKATSDLHGKYSWLFPRRSRVSEAVIWSRKLTVWTVLFVIIAVMGEFINILIADFLPPAAAGKVPALTWHYYLQAFLSILVPFTYGGIGSGAFLLRSCHKFIYTRQFDKRRISEYYNRMLLGIVSGGVVTLFVTQFGKDGDGAVRLAAAALGFLTGYNTDYIFSSLERLIAALLPKGDLTSLLAGGHSHRSVELSVSLEGVSLADLLERHSKTTAPEERKIIGDLIDRIKERL